MCDEGDVAPGHPETVAMAGSTSASAGPSRATIASLLLRPMKPIAEHTTELHATQPWADQAGPGQPWAPCATRTTPPPGSPPGLGRQGVPPGDL